MRASGPKSLLPEWHSGGQGLCPCKTHATSEDSRQRRKLHYSLGSGVSDGGIVIFSTGQKMIGFVSGLV
jgi:hypothetical protein